MGHSLLFWTRDRNLLFRPASKNKFLHIYVKKRLFSTLGRQLFCTLYANLCYKSRDKIWGSKFACYLNRGPSKLRKTFLWMKIFIFLPQHIFRFSKMADQKCRKQELSTKPGDFRDWKERFYKKKFSFFHPNFFPIFQNDKSKNLKKGTLYITQGFSRLRKTFLWIKFSFF